MAGLQTYWILSDLPRLMRMGPIALAIAGGSLAWTVFMGIIPSFLASILNCIMGITTFSVALLIWKLKGDPNRGETTSFAFFLNFIILSIWLFGSMGSLKFFYHSSFGLGLPLLQILAIGYIVFFSLLLGLRSHLKRVLIDPALKRET